jgi:hypothetical protein
LRALSRGAAPRRRSNAREQRRAARLRPTLDVLAYCVSALSVPEAEKRKVNVELGPFFLAGVVLFAYGLLRRRAVAAAAGLGAIWLDQRSEAGRSLKEKARAKYMTVQYVQDEPDRPGGQS